MTQNSPKNNGTRQNVKSQTKRPTNEDIENPVIHALYHETTLQGLEKILMSGKIKTSAELVKEGIGYVGNFGNDGFPGVYLSVLYNGQQMKMEEDDGIILVFSNDLMNKQKNWHYNLIDKNGTCGYDTYHYNSIKHAPHPEKVIIYCSTIPNEYRPGKFREWPGNEVVFHDGIDLNLLSTICVKTGVNQKLVKELIKKISKIDSKKVTLMKDFVNDKALGLNVDEKYLNKTSEPVVITISDNNYSGIQFGFYNKQDVKAVDDQDFINWTLAALPDNFKNEVTSLKTKGELDEWLKTNKIIEKLLWNDIPRDANKNSEFFDIFEKIRNKKNGGGRKYRKAPKKVNKKKVEAKPKPKAKKAQPKKKQTKSQNSICVIS